MTASTAPPTPTPTTIRSPTRAVLGASGAGRAALVVTTTAACAALLLVAVSLLRLQGNVYDEGLLGPIADPGTRGGAVLGVVLLTMPLVLLLDQAVRLGSSARERRYAALSVAGATRADLRRWGAVEVGVPALAGALLGVPCWLVLRGVLGTGLRGRGVALVPTSVGPGWWALLVLALVAAYGVLVGLRSGARTGPLLPAARRRRRTPRPWSLLLVVLAVAAVVAAFVLGIDSTVLLTGCLVLVVLGLAGASPWLAWSIAVTVASRTQSPARLLAARRLLADPRPAGRASAAVGAISLAGGVAASFYGHVTTSDEVGDVGYYTGPLGIIVVLLVLAVGIVVTSLAVHSTEVLLQRRREVAALVATGVPVEVVSRSLREESLIATVPLAVVGVLLGAFGYGVGLGGVDGSLPWSVLGVVVVVAVVAGAAASTGLLTRPWVRDAARSTNLRTE